MYQMMAAQLPRPEVVAILDPGRERQEAQIIQRGREYEQNLPNNYLDRVAKAYSYYYRHHRGSRVIWVDTSKIDFVARPEELVLLQRGHLVAKKARHSSNCCPALNSLDDLVQERPCRHPIMANPG